MYDHLPGGEILSNGLKDLEAKRLTTEALLVLVGAPRLARCGVKIPAMDLPFAIPEHELFRHLCINHGQQAYGYYRSLLRRLVSLEHALESQMAQAAKPLPG